VNIATLINNPFLMPEAPQILAAIEEVNGKIRDIYQILREQPDP
jgi:hypothetical protein